MATIRSWCFGFALIVWTELFGPVILVLIASQSAPPAIRKVTRIWASGILVLLRWIAGISYREQGRENIPALPCLIMCNHQSPWETNAALEAMASCRASCSKSPSALACSGIAS